MSTRVQKLFRKFDENIFDLTNQVKNSNPYGKITDQLSNFDDQHRQVIIRVINMMIFITPLFIVTLFYLISLSPMKEANQKLEELLSLAEGITSTNQNMATSINQHISPRFYENEQSLIASLNGIIASIQIETKNLSATEFQITDITSNLKQATFTLNFQDLTLKELTELIKELLNKEKLKLDTYSVQRNDETRNLAGKLGLIQLGKISEK
jgi:hypothetical protein